MEREKIMPGRNGFALIDRSMGSFYIDRHSGFAGGVFADFSARQTGLKELR
jgi:hypothetical protein